jgi:hypothetical protein
VKKTTRITSRISLAIVICALAVPLPRFNHVSAVSAQTASRPSDAPSALQGEEAIRSLKERGLYDSLQEAVTTARYEVIWEERPVKGSLPSAYHAPNPAQRYDAYFTPNGLSLAPRNAAPDDSESARAFDEKAQTEEAPQWQAAMRLIGYGYGENLLRADAAVLEVRDNRVEYRRAWPPITEWYVNQAAGLEQGFTIDAPPGIRSEGEQLRLALELASDLTLELSRGGQAIALKNANGEVALSYGGLYAYDAQGRELPSQMKLSKGQVILEVDDEKAVYPVTIDPTFSQQAKLLHNGGAAFDFLGSSVAIDGDTAVVGAHGASSAHVFVRSNTTWDYQAELTTNNVSSNGQFGGSVAISGDTVVVGARFDNTGLYHGSAHVFLRSGKTWGPPQKLEPIDSETSGWFGHSVAISGKTIVVGAPVATIDGNSGQGSAVVFVRDGTTWIPQQKLFASDGAAGDSFGYSAAITGNTVVTGALLDGIFHSSCLCYRRQGSAYVFVRNYTNWSQHQKLTASDGADYDRFGESVAINGSGASIVVGAPYDHIGAKVRQGSAYVFARNLSTWSQQWKLTASDGAADDRFGTSVSISGYEAIVGAPLADVGGGIDQGSAYVFARSGSTWSQQAKPAGIDVWSNHRFGESVAISVGTIVVGAPFWDYWGFINGHGAAYVFIR